ncbi:hypothetical protein [Streptomyces sp. NPDC004100]
MSRPNCQTAPSASCAASINSWYAACLRSRRHFRWSDRSSRRRSRSRAASSRICCRSSASFLRRSASAAAHAVRPLPRRVPQIAMTVVLKLSAMPEQSAGRGAGPG